MLYGKFSHLSKIFVESKMFNLRIAGVVHVAAPFIRTKFRVVAIIHSIAFKSCMDTVPLAAHKLAFVAIVEVLAIVLILKVRVYISNMECNFDLYESE